MTVAHGSHPFVRRSAPFVGAALFAVLVTSLLVVEWAVAVTEKEAGTAPVRTSSDSGAAVMDIGQQFYREKTMAPAHDLPAQF